MQVSRAFLDEEATRNVPGFAVAVKLIKDNDSDATQEFLEEAALIADLRHKHVLSLIGVVTRGLPKMMILPLCTHGDLRGFLQRLAGALNLKVGRCFLSHIMFFLHDCAMLCDLVCAGVCLCVLESRHMHE